MNTENLHKFTPEERARGRVLPFVSKTLKIYRHNPRKKQYNMQVCIPRKACRLLKIEKGAFMQWELSTDKRFINCHLALYQTRETTNITVRGNGQRITDIPSYFKSQIPKKARIVWHWNNRELYGQITLPEWTQKITTNIYAIRRERNEERRFRMHGGKAKKVPKFTKP